MFKLVLLRHGESQWNLENRFTGWTDVHLTKKGREEAKIAGSLMKKENILRLNLVWQQDSVQWLLLKVFQSCFRSL